MPPRRKTTHSVKAGKNNRPDTGTATVLDEMIQSLRSAGVYTSGDQTRPCAILWPDPDCLWETAIPDLKSTLPELFILGPYGPEQRMGPAVWLKCIEARALDNPLPEDQIPIFYLPGIGKQQLREVEDCPAELQHLVELQFRGAIWLHPNGKDWTPYAYLVSEHGGLGMDAARDNSTIEALQRALPQVLKKKTEELRGKRLDADFFDQLLAPDLPRLILNWMNRSVAGPEQSGNEWKAFCQQCIIDYHFHPEKDGCLRAAELLGHRKGKWAEVWKRFREAPKRYPVVTALLERMDPAGQEDLFFDSEPWPMANEKLEKELSHALKELGKKYQDNAVKSVRELEKAHSNRRNWVWRDLGRSQFAVALEYLDQLAALVEKPLAAASVHELGELYAVSGWKVDEASLNAMACCTSVHHEEPICAAVRSLYLPWLEASARNLQNLVKNAPETIRPQKEPTDSGTGQVTLFVDGLRFDVAQILKDRLQSQSYTVDCAWDWAPYPGVTATAKPFVSPLAPLLTGSVEIYDFNVAIEKSGKPLTSDRFAAMLEEQGYQILKGDGLGESAGRAWMEAGAFDRHGHNDGWKMVKRIEQEIEDLATRIRGLISAGWKEVRIVTDHGWLVMPAGLPKIDLPKFLVESRWGRCAVMKETAITDLPIITWHWKRDVNIATPPGAGCFKAGTEYCHGGLSLQELVVPRMLVTYNTSDANRAKIIGHKWIGLRCRVSLQEAAPGLTAELRRKAADPSSSIVEGRKARDVGADGTVSLPIENPDDEGLAVMIVLLDPQGNIIDQKPTVVGGIQ